MDVTADDLTKPLGLDARPDRFRRWRVPVAPILAGLIVALLGGFAALRPRRRRPARRRAARDRADRAAGTAASAGALRPLRRAGPRPRPPRRRAAAPPRSRTPPACRSCARTAPRRLAPSSSGSRTPENGKLAPAPDPRLVERSRHGLLPKVGAGRRASPGSVYARPAAPPTGGARPGARIALLVTGLGISPSATAGAIAKLPPAVTLAFAPYGARSRQDRGGGTRATATRSCSRCRWSRSTTRTTIPGRTR